MAYNRHHWLYSSIGKFSGEKPSGFENRKNASVFDWPSGLFLKLLG